MADNSTFITGVADGAFDGAFEDAFGDLPAWASDITARNIQGVLSKTLDLQTKSFTKMIKALEDSKKSGSQVDADKAKKSMEDFAKEVDKEREKKKKNSKLDDEEDKKKTKRQVATESASKLFLVTLSKLSDGIKSAFTDSVSTFDQLYKAGIDTVSGFESASNGLEALQQLSTLTGIRFTELAKTMEKYSTAVNSFGVGKFGKVLSATKLQLTGFGYSVTEAADLLGAYLESQQGFADVNSKTQAQVQKDLLTFGARITGLSQATGISRDKMLENIDAISQSIEANILSGQVGADAAAGTLEFISSFKDKNVGQAFLKMMTDSIKPLNSTFMDFQKTGFGGFGQKMQAFTQSLQGLDPREQARRTAEFAKANDQELQMMISRANMLDQAGVEGASGVLQFATGLRQTGLTYKEVSAKEREKADLTEKATKDFQNQWERLMSQLQQAFAPTIPMLISLAHGLVWVNTQIEKFAGLFDSATKSWIGVGIVVATTALSFKQMFQYVSKIVPFLGRLLGVVGLLYTAFEIGYSIGTELYNVLSKFDVFNDFMDGIFDTIFNTFDDIVASAVWIGKGLWSAGQWVVDAAKSIAGFISDSVKTISGLIPDWVKNAFSIMLTPLNFIIDGIASVGTGLWTAIKDIFNIFVTRQQWIADIFNSVIGSIKSLFSWIPGVNSNTSPSSPAPSAVSLPTPTPPPTAQTSTPKPSTLNSPSQVSTTPASDSKPEAQVKEPLKPNGSGIEKPTSGSDINNMLGYQTSLLEQLVQSTNSLVSVNKDILKYTRVHT